MCDPNSVFQAVLDRFIENDAHTRESLAERCHEGLASEVILQRSRPATAEECEVLAKELCCLPEELVVSTKDCPVVGMTSVTSPS